jgi:hypothetical protein
MQYKALIAGVLAVVAVVCVLSITQENDTFARESIAAKEASHVKGENTLRNRIQKAITVASKSLKAAKGKKQKAAARSAVKSALAAAGVKDADDAGTIAWAQRNIAVAKKWASARLKKDAASLSQAQAWTKGDRKKGEAMQKKCENAIQAMVAVASATKNKAQITKEDKKANSKKMAQFDLPIKNARKASMYAAKSVEAARAALAETLGTKARIAAKHALLRAQDAVASANLILKTEIGKKNAITAARLQADGLKLVGESELHYQSRKTFHKANRVLKLVNAALANARKNHYAHKEGKMKQTQRVTMEKAAKLQAQEKKHKAKAKHDAKIMAAREAYAAKLAQEALKYGETARDDAKKAAAAGKIAAAKALESAKLKAKLTEQKSGKKAKVRSTKMVAIALKRENTAAKLADKAAKMEKAIVTGGAMPKMMVETEFVDEETALQSAHQAASDADVDVQGSDGFRKFVEAFEAN